MPHAASAHGSCETPFKQQEQEIDQLCTRLIASSKVRSRRQDQKWMEALEINTRINLPTGEMVNPELPGLVMVCSLTKNFVQGEITDQHQFNSSHLSAQSSYRPQEVSMATPFDLSNSPNDRHWPYPSTIPLSAAQLIARHAIDAQTVALVWVLLEHGVSLTVAGPQAGVGKTTILYALLQFLPAETTVRYLVGMREKFSFTRQLGINPDNTYVISSEIHDDSPYSMWGEVARRFLTLPAQGYHIATTLHGNSLHDVLTLYRNKVHLNTEEICRLGIVVVIDKVPQQQGGRRWMTTHFIWPDADVTQHQNPPALLLSRWFQDKDAFERASEEALADLAKQIGIASHVFTAALARRVDCLRVLSAGEGADLDAFITAIDELRRKEAAASGSRGDISAQQGKHL